MNQFKLYSKSEFVEKIEALERLVQAQSKTIKELQQVINIHAWDRKMSAYTIKELVEQRNQLIDCVEANLKISRECIR